MTADLSNKTVLITGASSGLGERFAQVLSETGARVILAARREDLLNKLAEDLGNSMSLKLDVSDKISVQAAFAKLEKAGEKIDICINAAGLAKLGFIFDEEENDDFEEMHQVNVMGVWHVTKAVANHMKNHKIQGSIINIGSVSGDAVPAKGGAAYCSSKASVHNLTRVLVGELSPYNIRINTLSTWMIPTPMTQGFLEADGKEIEEMTPLGLAEIGDLDGAILFLASNKASRYMTGSCLTVDGGVSWRG